MIAQGAPAQLKARLGAEHVISLTVRTDPAGLRAELSDLPEVSSVDADFNGRLRVLANGGERTLATVVQSGARHDLTGVSVEPVSLETVFITLTGRQLRD